MTAAHSIHSEQSTEGGCVDGAGSCDEPTEQPFLIHRDPPMSPLVLPYGKDITPRVRKKQRDVWHSSCHRAAPDPGTQKSFEIKFSPTKGFSNESAILAFGQPMAETEVHQKNDLRASSRTHDLGSGGDAATVSDALSHSFDLGERMPTWQSLRDADLFPGYRPNESACVNSRLPRHCSRGIERCQECRVVAEADLRRRFWKNMSDLTVLAENSEKLTAEINFLKSIVLDDKDPRAKTTAAGCPNPSPEAPGRSAPSAHSCLLRPNKCCISMERKDRRLVSNTAQILDVGVPLATVIPTIPLTAPPTTQVEDKPNTPKGLVNRPRRIKDIKAHR